VGSEEVADGETFTVAAACPAGTVVGGGGRVQFAQDQAFATAALTGRYPDTTGKSWVVDARASIPGDQKAKMTLTAYAVCSVPAQ